MAQIVVDVVINQPVEKVFAFVTDSDNDAKWQSGVIETKRITPGPPGVGTRVAVVRTFLGQRLQATAEVTEYEPNKKSAFKSVSGPVKFAAVQTFQSVPGGTKFSTVADVEPGGFFKIAGPLFVTIDVGSIAAKKQIESDAPKLKEVLETMG